MTLTLTGVDVNGNAVAQTVQTDASGRYTFTQLFAGVYTVTETQPTNYNDGQDKLGDNGGVLGNDGVSAINLAGGVQATGYDFGERGTTVSGTVWTRRRQRRRAGCQPMLMAS
ncbi:MAG: hypothetical protein HC853_13215, partial [Anaerolineae bacterium]|nr:hypothetical protein [Anaerolineae bacterium]